MIFDEIREMVRKDMIIDDTELDVASISIPVLHNKYLNILFDERLRLKRMLSKHKELIRDKWEYYSGKMTEEDLKSRGWQPFQLKVMKTDLDRYIAADSEIIRVQDQIAFQEEKVDYLQAVVKSISGR